MFNFNFFLFIYSILPIELQKPRRIEWITVLLSSMKKTRDAFTLLTSDLLYKKYHNGLKIYLEKALNDKFDPIDRQIFIENVNTQSKLFIYYKPESKPKTYIYARSETPVTYVYAKSGYMGDNDFQVWIPFSLFAAIDAVAGMVDYYRPAGKRFTVVII
jgi:hypothetical protein